MATLAEQIEAHLKRLLAASNGIIEIQRRELARLFACVPSQINYVLETRFTPERGYRVESRRGGGGYIRITWLGPWQEGSEPIKAWPPWRAIGSEVEAEYAEELVRVLEADGWLEPRQGVLVRTALDQATGDLEGRLADRVRARVLRSILMVLLQ